MKIKTITLAFVLMLCSLPNVVTAQQSLSMDEVRAAILRDVGDVTECGAKPASAPDFFGHGEARLIGYLRGYDRQSGFTTAQIHLSNDLTGEDIPLTIEIMPDGWFTVDIPLQYPKNVTLNMMDGVYYPIYLEQGSRMGVIFDIEDLKRAGRDGDDPREVELFGPLAQLNRELRSFKPERFEYRRYTEAMERAAAMPPMEAVAYFREFRDRNMASLDSIRGSISDDAYRLLRYVEYDYFGRLLADVDRNTWYARSGNPKTPKLPIEFYSFLKEIPLDDPGFLTTGNWAFLNKYEFLTPIIGLPSPYEIPMLDEYLQKEQGVVLTAEDLEVRAHLDSLNACLRRGHEVDSLSIKELGRKSSAFYDRYKDKYGDDYQKYVERLTPKDEIDALRITFLWQDSVYYKVMGMPPGLLYDITKVRSLHSRLKDEKLLGLCRVVSDAIQHPFLKDEVWRMYEQTLPKPGDEHGYTLPDMPGVDTFRSITDQFAGNLVLVDFWGTGCGPCVGAIKRSKEQRAKFEAEGKLTYVFITDDSWSPSEDHYRQFVEEQALTNTFRLTQDDMNRFMQLFKFSSLPHYVLLGRDGRVLDDDFKTYTGMEQMLEKYTER
jgi:thiol-disulfide isomerase/thioredoxin